MRAAAGGVTQTGRFQPEAAMREAAVVGGRAPSALSCEQRCNLHPCYLAGPRTIHREKPTLPAVMGLKQSIVST